MKENRPEQPKNTTQEEERLSTAQEGLARRDFLKGTLALALGASIPAKAKEAAAFLESEANENKEGPKIEIEIFYGAHATGKDIEGLAEKIKGCDVFIPEMFGENPKTVDLFQRFSEGTASPHEYFKKGGTDLEEIKKGFKPFWAALAMDIYNTHKLVVISDVPVGHLLHGRLKHLSEFEFDLSMPFEKLVSLRRRWGYEFANLQKEREQLMLRRIMHLKKELAQGAIPRLRGKDRIKILVFLGAAHTGVYHELKRRGENVSRQFSRMPFIMGGMDENTTRHFLFGKKVSDELVARGLLGTILWATLSENYFPAITADTHLKIMFIRKISDAFSFEEIKTIFDRIHEEKMISGETMLTIGKMMNQKGLTMPESEETMKKAVGYDYKWGIKEK